MAMRESEDKLPTLVIQQAFGGRNSLVGFLLCAIPRAREAGDNSRMTRWRFRVPFPTLALLALSLGSVCGGQDTQNPSPTPVDWKALTPQIQAALGDTYLLCNRSSRTIEIGQTADITGGGSPEAVVAYCRQGPYTSNVALMMLEDGKPVLARFRSSKGKPVNPTFLAGASVSDGEGVKFLPFRHAFYDIQWRIDKKLKMEGCTVDAYVWNPGSRTFDQDESVSKEIAATECTHLREQLELETAPYAPKGKHH
jgi:hypothetical protein